MISSPISAPIGGLNSPIYDPIIDKILLDFANRVVVDGGTIEDIVFLSQFLKYAKYNPIFPFYNDIAAALSPSWGMKGISTAGILYSFTGEEYDINQVLGSKQPTITVGGENGRTIITTDGVDDFMQGAFAYVPPETIIFMGYRHLSWAIADFLFDGFNPLSGTIKQSGSSPDLITQVSGNTGTQDGSLALNTVGHLRALFDLPTAQVLQIDGNAETSDTFPGVQNMSGFTLGSRNSGVQAAHESVGAIVLLKAAVDGDYAAKMEAIRQFDIAYYGTPV